MQGPKTGAVTAASQGDADDPTRWAALGRPRNQTSDSLVLRLTGPLLPRIAQTRRRIARRTRHLSRKQQNFAEITKDIQEIAEKTANPRTSLLKCPFAPQKHDPSTSTPVLQACRNVRFWSFSPTIVRNYRYFFLLAKRPLLRIFHGETTLTSLFTFMLPAFFLPVPHPTLDLNLPTLDVELSRCP